jgi:S-adenosylmethionine decarboxylase
LQQKTSAGFLEQVRFAPNTYERVKGITQDFTSPNEQSAGANAGNTEFGTMGRHVIADLSGCSRQLISSVSFVQSVLEEAVVKAGATIINSIFHQFSPIGVSGIILLSESHCSIHTWPDEEYAAIDIYTCGEHVFPQIAAEHIASKLQAQEICLSSMDRGLKNSKLTRSKRESYIHHSSDSKIMIAERI